VSSPPATPADLILAALDAIVAAVEGVGLACTRDSQQFQPPGVLVGAPTITGQATMRTIGLLVPVRVVVTEPGQAGLDGLLTAVSLLLPVFGEHTAEPTTWSSPINPQGLPAYLIQVRANVQTEE
jgi:hypothetical protein